MTTTGLPQLSIPCDCDARDGAHQHSCSRLKASIAAYGTKRRVVRVADTKQTYGGGKLRTLDKATVRLAGQIYRQMTESYAEYLAACEADYARGFSASRCEHGTYLWTDYDPICGACEDGYSLADPIARRRYALDEAKERREKARAMIRWATEARQHGMSHLVDMAAVTERYDEMMGV